MHFYKEKLQSIQNMRIYEFATYLNNFKYSAKIMFENNMLVFSWFFTLWNIIKVVWYIKALFIFADKCPPGKETFIAHPSNTHLFYKCNGDVADLQECGKSTWSSIYNRCEEECPPTGVVYISGEVCGQFIHCVNGKPYVNNCAPGTVWNDSLSACVTGTC